MLQERLIAYKAEVAEGGTAVGPTWGEPGAHSDFLTLNEALLARDRFGLSVTDLSEFEMYNVSLWSNRVGSVVPRCGNCRVLTGGTNVLSEK